ncbi:MAG TPA: hypothetical protein VNM92_12430 [Thermoanaerobaculia bacterium]|nr:hypothetical protein [Thermoanaerobaculia bacterium]
MKRAAATLLFSILFRCDSVGPASPASVPATTVPSATTTAATAATTTKVRGMNFAHSLGRRSGGGRGYGSEASLQSLRSLRSLHVDSIAITPFGFQRRPDDTRIIWVGEGDGGRWIDETDDSLRAVITQAHQLGLRVLLKPHLWLRPPDWPGSIDHATEAEWALWFAEYGKFILHYARLAESMQVEMLSIGNELTKSTSHEQPWRDLIAQIRAAYRGKLTYGANMNEVFDVPFWDAVDVIGVSAYFPLNARKNPTTDEIAIGWTPIVARLSRLSRRTNRPVLFTELGYTSRDYATAEPWKEEGGELNLQLQAEAYQAFFQAVWPQPWFAGVYFWKWESHLNHSTSTDVSFAIEHKPAEAVVRKHFDLKVK